MDITYAQVADLEPTALRVLLRDGQPVERVWAAWVLGLRLGGQFTKELGPAYKQEPDAGVRRHLAVVLAGAGQRDALAAIAQADPDDHVRASAAQMLFQTAPAEEVTATVGQLVAFARSDASAVVREQILDLLEARWPAEQLDVLSVCLKMPQESVRAAAARVLIRADLLRVTAGTVIEHALVEPSEQLRRHLLSTLVRAHHELRVVGALKTARREYLADVVRVLLGGPLRFGWSELSPLAEHGDPELEGRLFELLRDRSTADLEFLVSRATFAYRRPAPTRDGYLAQRVGVTALEALAVKTGSPALSASQRARITQLVADIEGELGGLDPEWYGLNDEGAYEDAQLALQKMRDGLQRLLA